MIIYGTRLFGRVDRVPGMFHVATRFFHIDYLPLIPTASFIIVSETYKGFGSNFSGRSIPLSAKSIFIAWLRVACLAAAVILSIVALVTFGDESRTTSGITILVVIALLAIAAWITVMWHPWFTRASHKRAMYLANLMQLSPETIAAIAAKYGQAADIYNRGFTPVMSPPAINQPPAAVPYQPPPARVAQPAVTPFAAPAPPEPVQNTSPAQNEASLLDL